MSVEWCLVGPGNAREHITYDRLCSELGEERVAFCLLGRNGFLETRPNVERVKNTASDLVEFCERYQPKNVLILSPDQLIAGIADPLQARGFRCFAVSSQIARLEASKSFAKKRMVEFGVPTPKAEVFTSVGEAESYLVAHWRSGQREYVVKSDSMLANASHRVSVPESLEHARKILSRWESVVGPVNEGHPLLIEEKLFGEELSLHLLIDANSYQLMPYVKDYKRLAEGNAGPNTHGMGAVATTGDEFQRRIQSLEDVVGPTMRLIRATDPQARMILYIGVMLTEGGPKVLEYNVRSGNPEWLALTALLETPMHKLFRALLNDSLGADAPRYLSDRWSIAVMAVQEGYPDASEFPGRPIAVAGTLSGLQIVSDNSALDSEGRLCTAGGRVLGVLGTASTLRECREGVYSGLKKVGFDGLRCRNDIGGDF